MAKDNAPSLVCRSLHAFYVLLIAVLVPLLGIFGVYAYATGTTDLWYRFSTSGKAFWTLAHLEPREVNNFIASYEVFGREKVTKEDDHLVADYYNVLNHLCALGEVEKMYVPPVMEEKATIYENQLLTEQMIGNATGAKKGDRLLELGCGRGRISNHMARITGASVTGINLDGSQVANAREYAKTTGLEDRLEFHHRSMNDRPYPFANESFDGFYHVQALTYVDDLDQLFAELHRVLKPGATAQFLDWFLLDKYDATNTRQKEIVDRTKAIVAAIYNPTIPEYHTKLERNGFKIIKSAQPSVHGNQFRFLEKAKNFFEPLAQLVHILCRYGVLPDHLSKLLYKLNEYADEVVLGDEMGLFTMTYHIVAERI